jgi:hypothetical protein
VYVFLEISPQGIQSKRVRSSVPGKQTDRRFVLCKQEVLGGRRDTARTGAVKEGKERERGSFQVATAQLAFGDGWQHLDRCLASRRCLSSPTFSVRIEISDVISMRNPDGPATSAQGAAEAYLEAEQDHRRDA